MRAWDAPGNDTDMLIRPEHPSGRITYVWTLRRGYVFLRSLVATTPPLTGKVVLQPGKPEQPQKSEERPLRFFFPLRRNMGFPHSGQSGPCRFASRCWRSPGLPLSSGRVARQSWLSHPQKNPAFLAGLSDVALRAFERNRYIAPPHSGQG